MGRRYSGRMHQPLVVEVEVCGSAVCVYRVVVCPRAMAHTHSRNDQFQLDIPSRMEVVLSLSQGNLWRDQQARGLASYAHSPLDGMSRASYSVTRVDEGASLDRLLEWELDAPPVPPLASAETCGVAAKAYSAAATTESVSAREKRLRRAAQARGAVDDGMCLLVARHDPEAAEEDARIAVAEATAGSLLQYTAGRMVKLVQEDVVAHVVPGRHARCVSLHLTLDPGTYVVVPSRYQTGTRGRYSLYVQATSAVSMRGPQELGWTAIEGLPEIRVADRGEDGERPHHDHEWRAAPRGSCSFSTSEELIVSGVEVPESEPKPSEEVEKENEACAMQRLFRVVHELQVMVNELERKRARLLERVEELQSS